MAIIIDPSLSIQNLSQAIDICKENPEDTVFTCLSPIQQKYLAQRIPNDVKCLGIDWSIHERLNYNLLYPYWDNLEKLEEAKIMPWPSIFPYELNVAKIYRYYLAAGGPLFWSVLKILDRTVDEWQEGELVAIGKDAMFFAAIDSICKTFHKSVARKVFLNTNHKKNNYRHYLKKALDIIREEITLCELHGKKKKLFIDKHRQSMPLLPYLKESSISYFHHPFSPIKKKLMAGNYQRLIEETTNLFHEKMIDLVSRCSFGQSKLIEQSTLIDFIYALDSNISKAILDGLFIWKGLDSIKPDGALCTNWFGINHQFIRNWCKGNKKPFMVLQHGFYRGGSISPIEKIIDADVFFCWGPEMRKSFIEADPDNDKVIEVVGNTLYDRRVLIAKKSEVEKSLPKENRLYAVLIVPSVGSVLGRDYEDMFWNEMELAMIHFPQIRWIIKLHNLHKFKDEIKNRFTKLGATFFETGNIFDAMESCHLVIADISTVPLDAMVARKPVIIFNLYDLPERFSEFGAGIMIKEKGVLCNELEKLVKMNFFNPELMKRQERFVAAFSKPDGINNIVNSINRILSERYASKKKGNRS